MTNANRPGARHSARAGEIVLGGTLPLSIEAPELQRRADPPCRLIGWRVTRWLGVEGLEVRRGR